MGGRVMSALDNDLYLSRQAKPAKPAKPASSKAGIYGVPAWLDNLLTTSITNEEIDAICRRDYNVVSTNYGFGSVFLAKSEHARGKL